MSVQRNARVVIVVASLLAGVLSGAPDAFAAGSAKRKKDRTFFFTAITQAPARIQGPVQTGLEVTWSCQGNICTAVRKGAHAYELSIGMCARLVKQVGPLVEYGHQEEKMRPDHLASCHKHASVGAGTREPVRAGR